MLLNHLKYPVIPKKVTIGKRLAQCLHPALPSGVHLKALEAYDIIFKCIGPQRLAQDLFVYSAGLFPVIAHAAMSVKVSVSTCMIVLCVRLQRRPLPRHRPRRHERQGQCQGQGQCSTCMVDPCHRSRRHEHQGQCQGQCVHLYGSPLSSLTLP